MKARDVQLLVPMSGFGERFRRAGYRLPKPLIPVEGKAIIEHVVDLYPGVEAPIFVCNADHLAEPAYEMRETLLRRAPDARIVSVAPHKNGPVYAALQAIDLIDPDRPVIVNYCDFTCYWRFDDFLDFVSSANADAAIPCYRGFHPHSLRGGRYAYVRENGLWAHAIQEKTPFTDTPINEWASSGAYYFASGKLMREAFEETLARGINVGGEAYASLAYIPLFERGARVAVYPLQHFMQWGTPEDLAEYEYYSKMFRDIPNADIGGARQSGASVLLAAGAGARFQAAGYEAPKPLINVSGRSMLEHGARAAPHGDVNRVVFRRDLRDLDRLQDAARQAWPGAELMTLAGLTEGQAITALEGASGVADDAPVTIAPCDAATLYRADDFHAAMANPDIDVLIWSAANHPQALHDPRAFGWIGMEAGGRVVRTYVKEAPEGEAAVIIGAFTFKRAADLRAAVARLKARDGRVRGEFYLDSAIEDLIALGLRVHAFPVQQWLSWGTPAELDTFNYWQSCFHKWEAHPYRLERDPMVQGASALAAAYEWQKPPRPESA